jgi:hypothetical protein
MSTDRPNDYPDWAMLDKIDPISGENNAIKPPAIRAATGWNFREVGLRNWINWLHRNTALWIRYLDAPVSYTIATLPSNADLPLGKIIYVTDAVGGAVPAFNDGINWRKITDRSIVS